MKKLLKDFFDRYFHDEESIILVILLSAGLIILLLFGSILAPLIAAIIISYLMQGLVNLLLRQRMSTKLAFASVYILFVGIFTMLLFFVLPQVWNQLRRMLDDVPNLVNQAQEALRNLPENYPDVFSEQWVQQAINSLSGEVRGFGQTILEFSLASLPSLFGLFIFLILMPILVFFMMKDKDELVLWFGNFLPRNRPLMSAIWKEMDEQIANYIRGKVVEIIIVGSAAYLIFILIGKIDKKS